MAYKSGMLRVVTTPMIDTGTSDYAKVKKGAAFLPHRCDSWIIGSGAQVEWLIQDLQAYLNGEYAPEEEDDDDEVEV